MSLFFQWIIQEERLVSASCSTPGEYLSHGQPRWHSVFTLFGVVQIWDKQCNKQSHLLPTGGAVAPTLLLLCLFLIAPSVISADLPAQIHHHEDAFSLPRFFLIMKIHSHDEDSFSSRRFFLVMKMLSHQEDSLSS